MKDESISRKYVFTALKCMQRVVRECCRKAKCLKLTNF